MQKARQFFSSIAAGECFQKRFDSSWKLSSCWEKLSNNQEISSLDTLTGGKTLQVSESILTQGEFKYNNIICRRNAPQIVGKGGGEDSEGVVRED